MNNISARFKKLSTSSLSDAMDSLGIDGGLTGIRQQVPGTACAGPAFTVEYMAIEEKQTGFRNASNYIDEVPEGSVVVIDNQGKDHCTVWGDILTSFALQQGIVGTVIHGAVRDIARIRELEYPLFSDHIFMMSGKNRVIKREVGGGVTIAGVEIQPQDFIVADANGCVCIPKNYISTVLERAERIEKTEDLIKDAVSNGMSLKEARDRYGYHAPWQEKH